MAWPTSAFPTSLDTITDKISSDDIVADDINGAYDCLEHLEAKVGVDSSAVATSLDYLLKNASSSNPGHKHTMANGATDITIAASAINTILASGRKLWFYEASAPSGWTIQTPSVEALLAVAKAAGTYTTGGSQQGTWTQTDCTLIADQMPAHVHAFGGIARSGSVGTDTGNGYEFGTQGSQSYNTGSTGGGLPHNHGSTWRPLASVGIICSKD